MEEIKKIYAMEDDSFFCIEVGNRAPKKLTYMQHVFEEKSKVHCINFDGKYLLVEFVDNTPTSVYSLGEDAYYTSNDAEANISKALLLSIKHEKKRVNRAKSDMHHAMSRMKRACDRLVRKVEMLEGVLEDS